MAYKFQCVEVHEEGKDVFTVGKVYEVVAAAPCAEGAITSDNDDYYVVYHRRGGFRFETYFKLDAKHSGHTIAIFQAAH